ncbi:hypothetical protein [Pseudomonas indica]|uniref:hypothetical protein n=1 Tax=Pseudomonas indica TaxID=137658 RepID=UPI003FCF73A8
MPMPPLRPQHWLVFALVAVLFFGWGVWLMQARQGEPLPWMAEWQERLLAPLAEDRLTLAALSEEVEGELWLQPRLDEPRLLYRGQVGDADELWLLEAELALSDRERASLTKATGLRPTDAEQPLSRQVSDELGSHAIAILRLKPEAPMAAERLVASLGQPRLRLQLAEGEAWVYPDLGLTAHLRDDEVVLLHSVPRRALQQH